jgi:ElaB/YqjD/DUF883 family membrane-anchored ribosome-binding protein
MEAKVDAARLEEQYNRELDEMTDEIQAGIRSGKFSFGDLQRAVSGKAKETAEMADDLVRDNPWAAFGVAAGIGCLIGYLLSRD